VICGDLCLLCRFTEIPYREEWMLQALTGRWSLKRVDFEHELKQIAQLHMLLPELTSDYFVKQKHVPYVFD
jgi:hypothetical protein